MTSNHYHNNGADYGNQQGAIYDENKFDPIESTVYTVNQSIGLDLPGPRHRRSSSTINEYSQVDDIGWRPRRASIANGHIPAATQALTDLQKKSANSSSSSGRSESDHATLVEEACRNIAAAAVATAKDENSESNSTSIPSPKSRRNSTGSSVSSQKNSNTTIHRKKRRGGILGFKELAAKAGLSPWHFHRVFRSVTGLTPKAYGEACWQAVTAPPPPPPSQPQPQSHPSSSEEEKQISQSPHAPPPPQPDIYQHQPQHDTSYYLPSSRPEDILNATTILDSSHHHPQQTVDDGQNQLINPGWLDDPTLINPTENITPSINPTTEDMLNLTLDPNYVPPQQIFNHDSQQQPAAIPFQNPQQSMMQQEQQQDSSDWLGTGGLIDDRDPLLLAGSEWVKPTPL